MPLRPINNTVVVEPDPINKYIGNIVLPDKNSLEKISYIATVVSCSSDCNYKFKSGQRVILPSVNSINHETPIYHNEDGKKYRLIKEHKIYAVIED